MKLQQLLSLTRQAVDHYHMIEDMDRIAVGISGGKDSLSLLYALAQLKKFYPKQFDIIAMTVDLGFDHINFHAIKDFCDSLGIEYHVIKTQIGAIVFDERKEKNPCSLCSKMRKGALNEEALNSGCNKVAYAHHKDDLVESMFMSLIFEGRFHSFLPVTKLDRTGLVVIRPFLYLYEGQIKGFAREYQLPVLKSPCPVDGSTKRAYVKELIAKINKDHPGVKNRMARPLLHPDDDKE